MRWSVVDEGGAPAEGLHVLAGHGAAERTLAVPGDGVPALNPGEEPRAVLDRLGLREVAHRREGDRLVVDRADAFGWKVPGMPTDAGNDVELLQDSDMFPPMLRAIAGARESIHLCQLLLFKDFRCGPETGEASGRTLVEHLLDAAGRGVAVRILLNDNWLVPDSVGDVRSLCSGRACIEVRGFPMTPNVLHAKVLVVDGREAFIVGPPFQQRYWDTSSHSDHEPMRCDPRPLHDLSLRIRGPAVARVGAFFTSLWNARGPPAPPAPAPPPRGDQDVQLVTTTPPGLLDGDGWRPRAARESYQRAFANAEDFVYLETQYFTSASITQAIAAALHAKPRLQVILLLNVTVDVPLYVTWQKRRLASLGHPDNPRLGVFTLYTPTSDPLGPRPVYVHSKLALADDAWASVGTANLDSLSLERGGEWGVEVESNVDVNALLLDGVDGSPATGLVAAIRRRVWAEHLGDEGVWTAKRPEGGWLPLWRRVADANLEALREGRFPARGRILHYAPDSLPSVPPEEPPLARLSRRA